MRIAASNLNVMFVSHQTVTHDAVSHHGLGTQATKRTPIWPGGLSTAGGMSPP